MRLFVAIELSPELRRTLLEFIRERKGKSREVRWVGENQLHVTLRFLDEVDDARLDAVKTVIRETSAATPRFSLALQGLGGFPNPREPRVLWAGVNDPAEVCRAWVKATEPRFEELGIEHERRPFSAHVTLARSKTAAGDAYFAEILRNQPPIQPLSMDVSEVVLFRSELLPDGAKHTALLRAPLSRTQS